MNHLHIEITYVLCHRQKCLLYLYFVLSVLLRFLHIVFEVIRARMVCFNKGIKYCVRIQSYRYISIKPSAIPTEAFVPSELYRNSENSWTQYSGCRSEIITHPTATAATTKESPNTSSCPSLADLPLALCLWSMDRRSMPPVLNLDPLLLDASSNESFASSFA